MFRSNACANNLTYLAFLRATVMTTPRNGWIVNTCGGYKAVLENSVNLYRQRSASYLKSYTMNPAEQPPLLEESDYSLRDA